MSVPEDWAKDWDNPDDAIYDGPDAEQQAAYAKRKAMREYMELSQQIEDELIAEMGQEEYEASQHWINNPLIKPRSKVAIFEQWEERIRQEQNERIIKLVEKFRFNEELGFSFEQAKEDLLTLIKGEQK